jgi:NAD(P)-dependent dehydrogenase (short-subunit alcohol dehydrogenase family)
VSSPGGVCIVTGASRGLGAAIAEHLAAQGGASLALCARGADELEAVAASIRDAHGTEVLTAAVDVADEAAVRRFADAVAQWARPVRAVINNAGMLGPVGRLDTLDLGGWRTAFSVNVVGVVHVTAAFVPLMTSGGSVVNLSGGGVGGRGVQSHISAYTTAKGAIATLTETLARELAPLGIRVNAIAPGALGTELMRPVLDAGPERTSPELYETARRIYEGAPDRAPVNLDDRATQLLDFLLDDASVNVTGRVLSARWDRLEDLRAPALENSSRFTLRRIDEDLFVERRVD